MLRFSMTSQQECGSDTKLLNIALLYYTPEIKTQAITTAKQNKKTPNNNKKGDFKRLAMLSWHITSGPVKRH